MQTMLHNECYTLQVQQALCNTSYTTCTINRTALQVQYYNMYTCPVYSTPLNHTHSNTTALQLVK